MSRILKISKTRFSKIAITEFLNNKENLETLEEYKELFTQMAVVLYEIDSSESTEELNEKFENRKLFPVCTQEHKKKLGTDMSLLTNSILWLELGLDRNETAYTKDDVWHNLTRFNFL
jgi:hypothetical protein